MSFNVHSNLDTTKVHSITDENPESELVGSVLCYPRGFDLFCLLLAHLLYFPKHDCHRAVVLTRSKGRASQGDILRVSGDSSPGPN